MFEDVTFGVNVLYIEPYLLFLITDYHNKRFSWYRPNIVQSSNSVRQL